MKSHDLAIRVLNLPNIDIDEGGKTAAEVEYRVLAMWTACRGVSTHALEHGVISQMVEACQEAVRHLVSAPTVQGPPDQTRLFAWERELMVSRLRLVLAKITDREPEVMP